MNHELRLREKIFSLFIFSLFLLWTSLEGMSQDGKISLSELLRLAKERNPGLLALQEQIKAERGRVIPQATLPDPILNLSLKNMGATELSVGKEMMSGVGFSFSQMIPFPGKLRLQGEMAATQAQRAEQLKEAYAWNLNRQLKEFYAQLFYYQRTLEVLSKKKHFLVKALAAATSRYSLGEGTQNDVFKARLAIAELEQMTHPVEERLRAIEGQINSLLTWPIDQSLGQAEKIPIDQLNLSLAELLALAQKNSPKLKEAQLIIEEQEKKVELSRREFWPNFMIQIGKDFKGPFKDMYEIMVSVEVPLFFKRKQANLLEAALAELNQARLTFTSMEKEIQAMVNENYLQAKRAEQLIKLIRQNLLPQAALTLESSLANYQVGKVDFLALLEDIDHLYSYEREYYHELSELWQAVARLEELTGLNLLSEEKK
ncbi:MAG: TolC family protein [Candidatus Aminicenantes bacterium]|nr:TolC family protein [Candidatus Aminicenantes bacterium]